MSDIRPTGATLVGPSRDSAIVLRRFAWPEDAKSEFAELLEISVDFLSLIERGINAPSFENLEVFSTQLGIPVL